MPPTCPPEFTTEDTESTEFSLVLSFEVSVSSVISVVHRILSQWISLSRLGRFSGLLTCRNSPLPTEQRHHLLHESLGGPGIRVCRVEVHSPDDELVDSEVDQLRQPVGAVGGRAEYSEVPGKVGGDRLILRGASHPVMLHVVGVVDVPHHLPLLRRDRPHHTAVHGGEPGEQGHLEGADSGRLLRVVVHHQGT